MTRPFCMILLAGWCWSSLVVGARAESAPSAEQSIEAGRSGLKGAADFLWYDASKDTLRRIDVRAPSDLQNRNSPWTSQPPTWSFPSWLRRLFEVLGWTLLGLALLFLIYALVRTFLKGEDRAAAASDAEQATAPDAETDRIDRLPFPVRRPQADLLAEARRCYEAGDLAQAVIFLYTYQLLQMDRRQVIRLARGKTNRQYLRELDRWPALGSLFERTMRVFEEVFFGRHVLESQRFEACWNGLDEFHQLLEQAAE